MLALLVCNGARGLARRLAGSLALAAATLSSRSLEVFVIDSLDVLHNNILLNLFMKIHRADSRRNITVFCAVCEY